jgi:biopolymer transport protein ExbD
LKSHKGRQTKTMLMNKLGRKRASREENVIPMINIIFLLLLYFMVVGNLSPDYNVNPPFASQEKESSSLIPTISVTKEGQLRFENIPVSWEELGTRLRDVSDLDKIKIYADAESDALTISEIMKTAANVGIVQFVLVTQKKMSESLE